MDSMSQTHKKLVDGRLMMCPRCKRNHDILQYIPLKMIEEFASETTPCYKCPSCKWIFAPADQMPQDVLRNLMALLNKSDGGN